MTKLERWGNARRVPDQSLCFGCTAPVHTCLVTLPFLCSSCVPSLQALAEAFKANIPGHDAAIAKQQAWQRREAEGVDVGDAPEPVETPDNCKTQ